MLPELKADNEVIYPSDADFFRHANELRVSTFPLRFEIKAGREAICGRVKSPKGGSP